MRFTKNNKRFLFLTGFLALLQQDHARASATQANQMNPLMVMPQDVFNVQADNMSMKDLHALAQTSKAGLAKVKKYFAIKKNTFMNTKCPVLTREWVVNFSKTEPKKGLRDFFTKAQSLPTDIGQIVEIGGIKWAINVPNIDKSKLNDLPDFLDPDSRFEGGPHNTLSRENSIYAQQDTMFLDAGIKVGDSYVHTCSYASQNILNLHLSVELETMRFDEGASAAAAAPPAPSAR